MGRLIALFMLTTAVGLVGYHLPTQDTAPVAVAGPVATFREAVAPRVSADAADAATTSVARAKSQTQGLTPMEKLRAAAHANRALESQASDKTGSNARPIAPQPAIVAAAKQETLAHLGETAAPLLPNTASSRQSATVAPIDGSMSAQPQSPDPSAPSSWKAVRAATLPQSSPTEGAAPAAAVPVAVPFTIPVPVQVRDGDETSSSRPVSDNAVTASTVSAPQRYAPPSHLGVGTSSGTRRSDPGVRVPRRAFNTRQFWENSVQRGL